MRVLERKEEEKHHGSDNRNTITTNPLLLRATKKKSISATSNTQLRSDFTAANKQKCYFTDDTQMARSRGAKVSE